MQSETFKALVIPWILNIEGGFVNDADDRGGATQYGISLPLLKAIRGNTVHADDIKNLTQQDAIDIYYRHFWHEYECERFPLPIGLCLFDGLVNHRSIVAKRLIQKGLHITSDGIIGPVTLSTSHRSDVYRFLPDYASHRAVYYRDLTVNDRSQVKFYRGWLRRLFLLQQYIYQEILS